MIRNGTAFKRQCGFYTEKKHGEILPKNNGMYKIVEPEEYDLEERMLDQSKGI